MYLCNAEETEALSEVAFTCSLFTHCLKQDMNAFSLQLQMQK